MLLRTGPVLVALMLLAGVALGVVEARRPGWSQPVPPLMVLLGILLVVDLVMQSFAARGWIEPLTMPIRAAAFILGGLVLAVLMALMR